MEFAPRRAHKGTTPKSSEGNDLQAFWNWQQEATERACMGCEGPQEGSSGCGIFSEYTPEWAVCRGGTGHP